ncbi:WD40-repeat-containing domain protein [Fimicolochytrium jonesii]|uniref:WD40-repeat-containing domain protein n=1 Tax=Fimicolochytrium jonesii TaxID=1396493 RepID=UPI0022FF2590|nr:WD40-repeat-containing domain protein [Fimicolochytrium jonesii]KAI8818609.1 WD40-repeat-containing domain protein [Fimicolochytrium jonesii]
MFFSRLFNKRSGDTLKVDVPKHDERTARDRRGIGTGAEDSTEHSRGEPLSAASKRYSITDSATAMDDVKRIDFLLELPYELAVNIAAHVRDLRSVIKMAQVSRRWAKVVQDNDVWRATYATTYPLPSSFFPKAAPSSVTSPVSPSSPSSRYRNWKSLYQQRLKLNDNWRQGVVKVDYLSGHTDAVYCIQFDRDLLLSGSRDRTLKFWDLPSRQCVRSMNGHSGSVLCLQFDDRYIVTGSSDHTIVVWDINTRSELHVLDGHSAAVLDVRFNQDIVVSCSKDCKIKIWNIHTGKLIRTLEGHHAAVNAVHLHDGLIASASGDCVIKLWDVATGRCLREFGGHTRGLACVQFDGTYLVSGSNDFTINIWNARTGECLRKLEGHTDLVRTLCFDRKRIVSGSYDQTIKVWDFETGKQLLELKGAHSSWVFHVQMDATKIISSSQVGLP